MTENCINKKLKFKIKKVKIIYNTHHHNEPLQIKVKEIYNLKVYQGKNSNKNKKHILKMIQFK